MSLSHDILLQFFVCLFVFILLKITFQLVFIIEDERKYGITSKH